MRTLLAVTLSAMIAVALPQRADAVSTLDPILVLGPTGKLRILLLVPILDPIDEFSFYSDTFSLDTSFSASVFGVGMDLGSWNFSYSAVNHNGLPFPGGQTGIDFFDDGGSLMYEGTLSLAEVLPFGSPASWQLASWFVDAHDYKTGAWTTREARFVPEPATLFIFLLGVIGVVLLAKRHLFLGHLNTLISKPAWSQAQRA